MRSKGRHCSQHHELKGSEAVDGRQREKRDDMGRIGDDSRLRFILYVYTCAISLAITAWASFRLKLHSYGPPRSSKAAVLHDLAVDAANKGSNPRDTQYDEG